MKRQLTSIALYLLLLSLLIKAHPTLTIDAVHLKSLDDGVPIANQLRYTPDKEDAFVKRSSPRRHLVAPLLRSLTTPGSLPSTSESNDRERQRALERSQSFQGVTQLGHALVGSFVVSQAMNMDLYRRRQRGATDLSLPTIGSSSPYTGLDPLHAVVGAAISQAVTDPLGTYKVAKDCIGAACDAVSRLTLSSTLQPSPSHSVGSSIRSLPTSPRVEGVTGRRKVRKYMARKQRMERSRAKDADIKRKRIIFSS